MHQTSSPSLGPAGRWRPLAAPGPSALPFQTEAWLRRGCPSSHTRLHLCFAQAVPFYFCFNSVKQKELLETLNNCADVLKQEGLEVQVIFGLGAKGTPSPHTALL